MSFVNGSGSCQYTQDIGAPGKGAPGFFAVEQPTISTLSSGEFDTGHVGPGVGFSYGNTDDLFSTGNFGEPMSFLFFGATFEDGFCADLGASDYRATRTERGS